MTHYRILAWRDMPTQVSATDATGATVKRPMPRWFMQEISRITMREGLAGTDDYLDEFEWSAPAEREGTPDEVVTAVSAELCAQFGRTADGQRIARTERPGGDVTTTRRQMWDERHAAREPIESHEPDPTLAEVAGALAPGRAIDLAAGDGRNAIWLAARGWDVTAVDFSGVALKRAAAAAEAANVTVRWVNADLLGWRAESRSFDLVALMFLHLPPGERDVVYAGAAEAVAPGGRLLVVGHDRSNLTEGAGGPQDPAVLFTADDVALDLAGFEVERTETVARYLGDGRTAIDAVLVAKRPVSESPSATVTAPDPVPGVDG
jgi:SAM-dependent methyltransferase